MKNRAKIKQMLSDLMSMIEPDEESEGSYEHSEKSELGGVMDMSGCKPMEAGEDPKVGGATKNYTNAMGKSDDSKGFSKDKKLKMISSKLKLKMSKKDSY